jgi:hypothetical protein
MSATKKCLFCGRVLPPKRVKSGGKSDEHVIHAGFSIISVSVQPLLLRLT